MERRARRQRSRGQARAADEVAELTLTAPPATKPCRRGCSPRGADLGRGAGWGSASPATRPPRRAKERRPCCGQLAEATGRPLPSRTYLALGCPGRAPGSTRGAESRGHFSRRLTAEASDRPAAFWDFGAPRQPLGGALSGEQEGRDLLGPGITRCVSARVCACVCARVCVQDQDHL